MTNILEILSLLKNPTPEDKELLEKAYGFAMEAHKDQKRKSGEPYFTHLFETAKILVELDMSATTVSAGLLHDTVEDTGVTPEKIEEEFGGEIRFLVEGVTKLGNLKYRGTTRHSESLRKLFVAMSQDIRVLIIKLSDRLHNMRTLSYVPKEKQYRIAKETLEIYAPIAYRLGIRKLHRELEDLAFKYCLPNEYTKIENLVKQREGTELESLEKFHRALKKSFASENFTQFKTDYRIKGLYSLYKKLRRKDMDIEKVHDLAALRVIVPTISDCYRALGIIHGEYRPLPGRIKDYIAFPKTNGYQALHTTVFNGDGGIVEVQIKTDDMQKESEYGITSHIGYKQNQNTGNVPTKKKRSNPNLEWIKRILPVNFAKVSSQKNSTTTLSDSGGKQKSVNLDDVPRWVKDLVEYQKDIPEEGFLDDLRNDFFHERIFIFTPKGDVIDLPLGSSVVDFAYNIHSDIGNTTASAKVNGKFVAISTVLHNGDRVEIETKKNAKPNRKWLDFCKTTMAKKHIRLSLSEKNI